MYSAFMGLLVSGLAAYGVVALAMFLMQRRLLFRADRTPPDLARALVPETRSITVRTTDGLDLLAWYLPPPRGDGDVVLYLHGNGGHIGHRTYRLPLMRRHGWGVLMLEYRGYGGNPGRPSETGLLADGRAALLTLRALGHAPERVHLWGESLGSGIAVRLATEQPIATVLLEAPYTSITDIARSRYPFLPVRCLLRDRFESSRAIGAARAPVLVMHGACDTIVPVAMGRALHAAAPTPKHLWIAEQAGHVDLVEAGAIEVAAAFVARLAEPDAIPVQAAEGG